MTKDQYDTLSYKEKVIYDEFMALTAVMQKLLDVATHDP